MYLRVGDQEIVTHDLNLVAHELVDLGVVSPVILVKRILNRKDGVLAHKGLVQLNEIIALQLCFPIVVLFSENSRNSSKPTTSLNLHKILRLQKREL